MCSARHVGLKDKTRSGMNEYVVTMVHHQVMNGTGNKTGKPRLPPAVLQSSEFLMALIIVKNDLHLLKGMTHKRDIDITAAYTMISIESKGRRA